MPPKKKVDKERFQVRNRKGERITRLDGEIDGLDFYIESCEGCHIFLLDRMEQIIVEACQDCTLVLGPVAGSIFLRECVGCQVKVACRQFRTRDCRDCDILILLPGSPTIEASQSLRFGPLLESYRGFGAQLEAAGLSRIFSQGAVCNWRQIYDFSCSDRGRAQDLGHWRSLSREEHQQVSAAFPVGPIADSELVRFPVEAFAGGEAPVARGVAAISVPATAAAAAPASSLASALASAGMPGSAARAPTPLAAAAAAAAVETAADVCCQCGSAPADPSAKLMVCGGCGLASYCGVGCQRAAWKSHKKVCAGRTGLPAARATQQQTPQQTRRSSRGSGSSRRGGSSGSRSCAMA